MSGRDPSSIAALKSYGRGLFVPEDEEHFLSELAGQSDRAMAILVGACVEDSLRDHIRGRLRPDLKASEVSALLDGDAPLATFSAKIRFGYAASLYGPLTRDDLDLIRLIRNTCAHSQRRVSFDLAVFSRPIERLHRIKGHVETVLVGGNTPRNRFIRAAMMIDMALMGLTNGKYKEEDRGFLLP